MAPEAGRDGARARRTFANPRQGGVTPPQRQPGLIWGWRAPGRAKLGCTGLNRALFDPRMTLRQGEGSPCAWDLCRIQGPTCRSRRDVARANWEWHASRALSVRVRVSGSLPFDHSARVCVRVSTAKSPLVAGRCSGPIRLKQCPLAASGHPPARVSVKKLLSPKSLSCGRLPR